MERIIILTIISVALRFTLYNVKYNNDNSKLLQDVFITVVNIYEGFLFEDSKNLEKELQFESCKIAFYLKVYS